MSDQRPQTSQPSLLFALPSGRDPHQPMNPWVVAEQHPVMAFVRSEYWRLAAEGRIPYDLPVCPKQPEREDHRD